MPKISTEQVFLPDLRRVGVVWGRALVWRL